ncbi:MAG: YfhO family protein [Bacteroidota bacterium]
MKSFNWKSLIPHLIAVGVFLLVALIFCSPALDSSVVIQQGDMAGTQGMTHQSFEYQQLHGHLPLWTTNMFGGMPAFQTVFEGPFNPLGIIDKILQLGLPKPINYFFLLSLGFYFLTVFLNIRTWVGIVASLAYAYCLYDPIIAVVGHQTKILAMAYAPALLGSIILIFEKKYLKGFILSALFTALELQQNHTQISYYLFLVIALMTITYMVRWVMVKDFKHVGIAFGLALVAGTIGVLANAVTILPVADYVRESKRAGQLVMDGRIDSATNIIKDNKTKGMSKEYAFQWSYGKVETMSLMFPGVMGYGYHGSERDGDTRVFPELTETSHVAEYLNEKLGGDQGSNIAPQLGGNLYWGDQPFTAGPVYLGAIVCFLFLFGMFYLDNKHKWWALAAAVLGILLSWGSHFMALNGFMFDYFPFYNKFRVPTLALFIPQLVFPIVGALALNKLCSNQNEETWKKFRLSVIATGVVFAIAAAMYFTADYAKENKARTSAFNVAFANPADQAGGQAKMDSINRNPKLQPEADNQLYENFVFQSKGDVQMAKGTLTALREDRASLFGKDILRSFAFVALTIVLIGLFIRKKINMGVMLGGVGILILIDLLSIGFKYLNKTSFTSKDGYENKVFEKMPYDDEILKDTDPNYRVFNFAGGDPFQESKTSYYHKSIGGYHPTKLALYEDLITYQISKNNQQVLDMLNTKYIVFQNPQTKQPTAERNPGALGNCWFVKGITYVKGGVEEMRALTAFNPKDTAIVDEKYKADIGAVSPADSLSTIKQTAFDNDAIKYESNSPVAALAIFSEIYYKDWYAYIDGAKGKVIKANYALRGLAVPAGKHTIEFKFEPASYKTGSMLTSIASWLLIILLLAYVAKEFFMKKKQEDVVAKKA